MNEKRLIRYVRNSDKTPKGVLIAKVVNDNIIIGWSYCAKDDNFEKKLGRHIAEARIQKCGKSIVVPRKIYKELDWFVAKAKRAFGDKDVIVRGIMS